MRLLRCENCGAEGGEGLTVGWIEANYIDISILHYGEIPGPWHFNNFQCLSEWADKRSKEKA